MLVLGVPDCTVDEGDSDCSVVECLDVLLLSIDCDRPHDDVCELCDGQNPLVGVEDGDIASTAGCGPVDGDLDLTAGGCRGEELSQVCCGVGVEAGLGGGLSSVGNCCLCRCRCCGCCLGGLLGFGGLCGLCLVLFLESVEESHFHSSLIATALVSMSFCFLDFTGVGPRALMVSTNSTTVFWNFSPSEAETH